MAEPKPTSIVFGANVERERQRQSLARWAAGAKAALDSSEIGRLERGLRDPRLSTVVRIARGLGVPIATLMEGVLEASASEERDSTDG